jgi:hypothetical protein
MYDVASSVAFLSVSILHRRGVGRAAIERIYFAHLEKQRTATTQQTRESPSSPESIIYVVAYCRVKQDCGAALVAPTHGILGLFAQVKRQQGKLLSHGLLGRACCQLRTSCHVHTFRVISCGAHAQKMRRRPEENGWLPVTEHKIIRP